MILGHWSPLMGNLTQLLCDDFVLLLKGDTLKYCDEFVALTHYTGMGKGEGGQISIGNKTVASHLSGPGFDTQPYIMLGNW